MKPDLVDQAAAWIASLSYTACALLALTGGALALYLCDINRAANFGVLLACALVAVGTLIDSFAGRGRR